MVIPKCTANRVLIQNVLSLMAKERTKESRLHLGPPFGGLPLRVVFSGGVKDSSRFYLLIGETQTFAAFFLEE
jgi:hypothetical protein